MGKLAVNAAPIVVMLVGMAVAAGGSLTVLATFEFGGLIKITGISATSAVGLGITAIGAWMFRRSNRSRGSSRRRR